MSMVSTGDGFANTSAACCLHSQWKDTLNFDYRLPKWRCSFSSHPNSQTFWLTRQTFSKYPGFMRMSSRRRNLDNFMGKKLLFLDHLFMSGLLCGTGRTSIWLKPLRFGISVTTAALHWKHSIEKHSERWLWVGSVS